MFNPRFVRLALVALLPLVAPAVIAQTAASAQPGSAAQANSAAQADASLLSKKTGNTYRNCPINPRTRYADCSLEIFTFDQPAAGIVGEAAHHVMMDVSGPGLSIGNSGGWRVPKLEFDNYIVAARGIAQSYSLAMIKHAVGDTMGHYDYIYSDGGSTAESDESIKGYAIDLGETNGYFHGSIASTTGTGDIQPALTYASGNNWTTDGAELLDISKGTISGHITGPSAPLPGSTYLNTFPVDNTLPLTTAWGICNDNIPFNKLAEVNKAATCNVTLKMGQFKPGGQVCVTGTTYPEQAPILAVDRPTNGTQKITISVRNPHKPGGTILQGGVCGQFISFDANLATTSYRSSYYAFGALDPHHLIYGMNIRGTLAGNTLPMSGSEAEQFGVEGFNGYHLYPGCEVITNQTTAAKPICEPNSVPWAAGDLVEAPHSTTVNTTGFFLDIQQNTPSNGGLSSGDLLQFHGFGTVGRNFMAHRTNNGTPYTVFKPFGGPFDAPSLHSIDGYFSNGMFFRWAPGSIVTVAGNADRSKSVMTLFTLPGGTIRWDPATATLLVDHLSAGSITSRGAAPAVSSPAAGGLRGTTGRIGGAALALGVCASGTATIPGATVTMIPVTVAATTGAPGFSPSGAFQVNAQVTAPNTVTVNVCAVIAGTPRPSTYLVALQ